MRDGAYWERAYRDLESTYRGQAAELDRLRAEVEQWRDRALRGRAILKEISECDAAKENDRLRAENERLEGEISTTMTMRLKAENDRLRDEKAELVAERDAWKNRAYERLKNELDAREAATIERCAQVADDDWDSPKRIANAIRAIAKANETEGK